MGIEVAIAGLVIAAVGTAAQADAAQDAAKAQEEQQEAAGAVTRQKIIEERRANFRKRRIAAARIRQGAENTGTGGSSAEAGALASLATQGAAFRGGLTARTEAGKVISAAVSDERAAGIQGQLGAATTQLGLSIFSAGLGGFGAPGPPNPAGA